MDAVAIVGKILLMAVAIVPAVVLHEIAHGWAALALGDQTARRQGRLSLNPLRHVDPVGTLLIPGGLYLLYLLGISHSLFLFGWAKPVPVNFSALRNPRRDMAIVAAAGPVMNLVLAAILVQILRSGLLYPFSEVLLHASIMNVGLAIFNLVPLPPLDGSRVMTGLLPLKLARIYYSLEPYGLLIVAGLLYFGGLDFVNPLIILTLHLLGL